ncbi:MAG: hypothetical protein MRY32_08540 [Rickettsiales bacterium]|nr:hypothetical protein [Rickettsiales bacterium]
MNDLVKLSVGTTPTPARPKQTIITKEKTKDDRRKHYERNHAIPNYIPTPEQLSRLINRALDALANGVYWDRGSIINIVL